MGEGKYFLSFSSTEPLNDFLRLLAECAGNVCFPFAPFCRSGGIWSPVLVGFDVPLDVSYLSKDLSFQQVKD